MAWISDNYGFGEESDPFLQKISINQLSPELSQVLIVGVIVAKQDIRRIISKKRKFIFNLYYYYYYYYYWVIF